MSTGPILLLIDQSPRVKGAGQSHPRAPAAHNTNRRDGDDVDDLHDADLEDRLRFERLIADLSAEFVNLDSNLIDGAIQNVQRRLVEALDLDRSTLFQFSEDGASLTFTHYWSRPDLPPPPLVPRQHPRARCTYLAAARIHRTDGPRTRSARAQRLRRTQRILTSPTRRFRADTGDATVQLQLSQIREKSQSLVGRNESAVDHESIGRENRRQIWRRIQARRPSEEGVVEVEHFLERGCGIVVKVRRGSADAAQLCGVHHTEVTRLACQEQPAGI
jgi:hypothetical protein